MDKTRSTRKESVAYAGSVSAIELRKAAFSVHTGHFERFALMNWKLEKRYEVDSPLGKRYVQLVKVGDHADFIPMAHPEFRKRNPGQWEHDFGNSAIDLRAFFRVGGWKKIYLMIFDLKVKYYMYNFDDQEMLPRLVDKSEISPDNLILSKGNMPNEKADKFPNSFGGGNIFVGSYIRDYISRNGTMPQGIPDHIKILVVLNELQILTFKLSDDHRVKGEVEQLILGGTSQLKWPVEMVEKDIVQILMKHHDCLPGIAARYFTCYDMMNYVSLAQAHLGIMMNESDKINQDFGTYRIGNKNGMDFNALVVEVMSRSLNHKRTYVTEKGLFATLQSEVQRRENCFLLVLPRFHYVEREYAMQVY